MFNGLKNNYILISPEKDILEFINHNKDTLKIINAIEPHLSTHFPNNEFSLELCDKLGWTTETKLLLNVRVGKRCFLMGCWIISMIFTKKSNLLLKISKIL